MKDYYTCTEYATKLQVSTKTIRRMIKAGQIPGQLVRGQYGMEYRIPKGEEPHKEEEPGQEPGQDVQGLIELVSKLHTEVRDMALLIGGQRERIEILERKLLTRGAKKRKRRPWWKRIF